MKCRLCSCCRVDGHKVPDEGYSVGPGVVVGGVGANLVPSATFIDGPIATNQKAEIYTTFNLGYSAHTYASYGVK